VVVDLSSAFVTETERSRVITRTTELQRLMAKVLLLREDIVRVQARV
jgi:hypothetical protein